jgi:hypothetical protein
MILDPAQLLVFMTALRFISRVPGTGGETGVRPAADHHDIGWLHLMS